ncbi:MAG: ABC transporter substrate-binding protein [Methanosarcinales archaeon]|jgi:NitT/TauT family transport system substrate-binding protein|nr:ABC transporter substrate-binding protein [Methanosarcinales archaeon]
MKKIMFIGFAVLLIAASFSGCLGGDSGTTNVVIGYQPSTHHMAFTTAKELGWWSSNLTQMDEVRNVSDRSFPSGPSQATALASGAIHIAYIGAAPLIPAIAQNNADLKIIAAVQVNGSSLIVPTDADYTGPSYFEGKTIATFPPGSIQDTLLRQWLIDNGVNLSRVDIRGMDSGEAQTALRAGAVDAVFLPHPAPSIIVNSGVGKVVMESGDMSSDHACCVLAVSQRFIDEHPDIVAEILRIHINATIYTNANPEDAARYYANVTGVSEAVVLQSISEWDGAWIADPRIIEEYVVEYARIQYEQGLIPRPLTSAELFDMSFFDAYVSQR